MNDIDRPSHLPCEKCGEMTKYDGAISASLPCAHCGTSRPHTMTGSTGKPAVPFIIYFSACILSFIFFPLPKNLEILYVLGFFVLFIILCGPFLMALNREMKKKGDSQKNDDNVWWVLEVPKTIPPRESPWGLLRSSQVTIKSPAIYSMQAQGRWRILTTLWIFWFVKMESK